MCWGILPDFRIQNIKGFPHGTSGKRTYQCRWCKRWGLDPWVGKSPWRKVWQFTPVFLPGEFHGQRSLVGCSPWGLKELDVTEATIPLTFQSMRRKSSWRSHRPRKMTVPNKAESLIMCEGLVMVSRWYYFSPRKINLKLNATLLLLLLSCFSHVRLYAIPEMAAHQTPVPGILQARTLEWVAISFSKAWKWKVKVKSLSRVQLLVTAWTAAYQAPLSMGFSRQEYWSGVPSRSPVLPK